MSGATAPSVPGGRDRATPGEPTGYGLLLRGLVVAARIGVHDHERRTTQRVRITLDLAAAPLPAKFPDRIGSVIDYERLVAGVEAIATAGHINLLETLGVRIAEFCLDDAGVIAARVVLEKLDLYPHAESVGVVIERRRRA